MNRRRLSFTKMHGLGNDFMVIDTRAQQFDLSAEEIRQLANRHTGIGFDQLLLVAPASKPANDFSYRIFNSDGGEVEHCGNGARCFVRFVSEQGLSSKKSLRVEIQRGEIILRLLDNGEVEVNMGEPIFTPAEVPFLAAEAKVVTSLVVDGNNYPASVLSMGNPHAVLVVANTEQAPVTELGRQIQALPSFPQGVNVGFMEIVSRAEIRLRVFERGAGETLSCGTGACAAVVAGIRRGLLDSEVKVATHGGVLTVGWSGERSPILMTGPATTVYHGEVDVPRLGK